MNKSYETLQQHTLVSGPANKHHICTSKSINMHEMINRLIMYNTDLSRLRTIIITIKN